MGQPASRRPPPSHAHGIKFCGFLGTECTRHLKITICCCWAPAQCSIRPVTCRTAASHRGKMMCVLANQHLATSACVGTTTASTAWVKTPLAMPALLQQRHMRQRHRGGRTRLFRAVSSMHLTHVDQTPPPTPTPSKQPAAAK